MTTIAYVDAETVTLDPPVDADHPTLRPGPGVLWEIAVILDRGDVGRPAEEYVFQLTPDMTRANPQSLEVSRHAERYQVPPYAEGLVWADRHGGRNRIEGMTGYKMIADMLVDLLSDATIIGDVPSFDTARLEAFIRAHGHRGDIPWQYRIRDIYDLADGYLLGRADAAGLPIRDRLGRRPDSATITAALGLPPIPPEDLHTPLGDARHVRRIHRALVDATIRAPGTVDA